MTEIVASDITCKLSNSASFLTSTFSWSVKMLIGFWLASFSACKFSYLRVFVLASFCACEFSYLWVSSLESFLPAGFRACEFSYPRVSAPASFHTDAQRPAKHESFEVFWGSLRLFIFYPKYVPYTCPQKRLHKFVYHTRMWCRRRVYICRLVSH